MCPTLALQYSKCGQTAKRLLALDKFNDILHGSFQDTSANTTCALRYSNPQFFISEWAAKEESKLIEVEKAKAEAKKQRKKGKPISIRKSLSTSMEPPLDAPPPLPLVPVPATATALTTEDESEDLPPLTVPPPIPQSMPPVEDLSLNTTPPTPPPKPTQSTISPPAPIDPTSKALPKPPPRPPPPPIKKAPTIAEPPGKSNASAAIEGLLSAQAAKSAAAPPPPKPPSPSPNKVKASAALEGLFASKSAPTSPPKKTVETVAPDEAAKARLAKSKKALEKEQAANISSAGSKEQYKKYDMMRRMLPEGAVRQKMEMEGISKEEIDAYMSSDQESSAAAPSTLDATSATSTKSQNQASNLDVANANSADSANAWKEFYSEKHKRKYYKNTITKETTWNKPPGFTSVVKPPSKLPPNPPSGVREWAEKFDEKRQRKFWKNIRTKETTWKDPYATAPNPSKSSSHKTMDGAISSSSSASTSQAVAPESPQESTSLNAAPADPRYEKFVKMLRMLPEGAVRQKMSMEGFVDSEIESFISSGGVPPTSGLAPATTTAPPTVGGGGGASEEIDPRYEKFVKMMRMLPEGAVRQKMSMEGFTDTEIDVFISNGAPKKSSTTSPSVSTAPTAGKQGLLAEIAGGAKLKKVNRTSSRLRPIDSNASAAAGSGSAPSLMDQLKQGVALKKTAPIEKPPEPSSSGGMGGSPMSELMKGIQLGTSRLKKVDIKKKTSSRRGLFKDAAVKNILARRAAIDAAADESDGDNDEWD